MRFPGKVLAGHVSNAIFATIDLLPTFGNLAGYETPDDRVIDGIDQTDLLMCKSEQGGRETFIYDQVTRNTVGIRHGKWKLLLPGRKPDKKHWYLTDFGTNGFELYDLDADMGEQNNLADKYPEKIKELSEMMNEIINREP